MFIKNNLVVDRKTFMKATISTKQRKKIIAATRKAELELEDTYANALIQACAQSRELKHSTRVKK